LKRAFQNFLDGRTDDPDLKPSSPLKLMKNALREVLGSTIPSEEAL
jgi:hypothetical protein